MKQAAGKWGIPAVIGIKEILPAYLLAGRMDFSPQFMGGGGVQGEDRDSVCR